jgi:hypothetical protein
VELQTVSAQWQRALDAADRALSAAGRSLPAAELVERRHELVQERRQTAEALARLADASGARAERLRDFGAERVVSSLGALFDPRLSDGREALDVRRHEAPRRSREGG